MRTKQSRTNQEARAAGKARRVRSSALGKLLIMLAVVAAIVFGVAIFFKVNTIEVQGNTVYSSEQIVEASQIQPGDNLLTVNKALAVGNIKAALPYVEDVSIARSLPDGIIIQVRESTISFAVMTDTNTCWLIGPSGKALERIEPAAFNEYPHINGLLLSGPTMGQSVASPTPTALAAALDVLSELDGTGLLLTGSNMSGKTTFIRTVMLNALLGETLCTCFAERFTAPYMRLHSSIRISDDITEGTSYYLQEVLTVKRLLEDADRPAACLFVLDELFKGTNTTERIAAGKAVLARLNRGPHIVLAATHDIELAELLRGDGYELHHFREEVADGRLVFDYCLHTGPLTTRNAIRILELYDYPPELIAEAYDTQQKLLGNG